jgi:hypothetical protein
MLLAATKRHWATHVRLRKGLIARTVLIQSECKKPVFEAVIDAIDRGEVA